MLDLQNAMLHLTTTADSPYSDESDRVLALQGVVDSARRADITDINKALGHLTNLIDSTDDMMASMISVGAGALVEFGGDPSIAFSSVLERTWKTAQAANRFAQQCLVEGVFDAEDIATGMQILAEKHPDNAQNWQFLDKLYLPVITMTSRSKSVRAEMKQNHSFCTLIADLAPYHTGANWLHKMCQVLDDESIIVLHPKVEQGYSIKISGIADNFQLHILLADALIGDTSQGWLSGERPDPDIVNAMKDQQPDSDLTAVGVFNLVQMSGLDANGQLSAATDNSEHWIWNEGIPADIQKLNGKRIILLQDPPYQRSWNAVRPFSGMKGEISDVTQLSLSDYKQYIERIILLNYPNA